MPVPGLFLSLGGTAITPTPHNPVRAACTLHVVQVAMRPEGEEGTVLMAPYSVGILAPGQLLILSKGDQL